MASIIETLPIELITAIIESLAAPILPGRNDNSSYDRALNDLKACSLACRHFLPLCQKYVFNTIILETHDRLDGPISKSPGIGRFAEIVKASPNIGIYVEQLRLWITPNFDDFEVDYHPEIVASALRSLTNLKAIFLQPWESGFIFDWNHVSPSFRSEIYRLFELPKITTIEVQRTQNFNIHSLAPCSGLKSLIFRDSSLDKEFSEIPSTTASVKPIQPIMLHLLGNSKATGLLLKIVSSKLSERNPLFDFGRLETFLMAITFTDDVRTTSDFLRQVKSPVLKTIDLSFTTEIDKDGIAALSLNSAMKVIKNLVIWFICPSSGINEHLLGMCILLQNLSTDNRIQALKITMDYRSSTSRFLDDPNWDVVNDILLGPGWSSLAKVELDIMSYTDQHSLPQAMTRAAMLKNLPQTRLKGLSSNKSFQFLWNFKSIVQDPRGFQYIALL